MKKTPPKPRVKKKPAKNYSRSFFPAFYGVDTLVLIARDPWWIYAYWEVTPKTERVAMSGVRVLRVTCESGSGGWFDIDVGVFSDNWYVDVGQPDQLWSVELGIRAANGCFYGLIKSNRVRTPRVGISDKVDPEWQLPDEISKEIFKASGSATDSRSSFDLVARSLSKESQ